MTNAAPDKVALLHIPISLIDVKEQVRRKFDDKAHKELTESIRTKGVINPIALRPSPRNTKRYELVAGERRYRAAAAAGLTEILSTVRDLDDESAALFQVEENIHRKDLTPIEEARAFKALLDAKKFTVEQLAQLVDKSLPYVYRAVNLLELPENIVSAIEEGKITPAHGHQILRVPLHDRGDICAWTMTPDSFDNALPTAKEVKERIEQELGSNLDDGRFIKNKPYAGEMACTACPYNSGNQGKLFDGAEKGVCSNSPCFEKKVKQHLADRIETAKEAYPDAAMVIVTDYAPFAGQSLKGGFMVTGPLEKKLLKGGAVVICRNVQDKLWQAKVEKKEDAPRPSYAVVSPRDGYIRKRSDLAVLKAVAEKCKVFTRDVATAIFNAEVDGSDDHYEVLGLDPEKKVDVSKLTLEQVNQLAALCILGKSWHIVATCKTLKINIDKIVADTAKTAGAEFDAKNLKHKSVANGGSESACGLKGTGYTTDNVEKVGMAVPDWQSVTCPACKKKAPK